MNALLEETLEIIETPVSESAENGNHPGPFIDAWEAEINEVIWLAKPGGVVR